MVHMSKNKKIRRKSRHRKSLTNTKPTQDDIALVGTSSSSAASKELSHFEKTDIDHPPISSVSLTQSASYKISEKKLTHLSAPTSTNDSSSQELESHEKCTSNKRRRTTRSDKQSRDDGTTGNTIEVVNTVAGLRQPNFPYPVDPDDHCESPMEAYGDIVHLLSLLGTQLYSNSHLIRIYDPYYCDGAVVRNFASFGFDNVYNRKEDCYTIWKTASTSADDDTTKNIMNQFDVVVTNPPYSDDHIERLIQFVTSDIFLRRQKPWFLLLPQWVHKKDYYIKATSKGNPIDRGGKVHQQHQSSIVQPFYIIPKKRYIYTPPPNFRMSTKSDVHKKSSPFISMWYCWGGSATMNEQLIQHFYNTDQSHNQNCDLARSKSAIRDLRRIHTSKK